MTPADGGAAGVWLKKRRTHSVHDSYDEAKGAAYDLARLTNGVPVGFVFAIWPKMGKFAFISMPAEAYAQVAA